MAGYGVIGKERGSNRKAERVIIANLDDLCEEAAQSDEEFYLYIAVPKVMGQGLLDVLTWAVEHGVWYKLFYEKGYLDADVFAGAEEKMQVPDYAAALQYVVQECNGAELTLLALYVDPGEDEELDNAVASAMAVDVAVKMLNDAGLEAFEPSDDDEAEEAEDDEEAEEPNQEDEAVADADDDEDATPDQVREYGEQADGGDEAAATQLQEWAESADIDANEYDTWAEVAELLVGMLDTGEEESEEAEEPDAKAIARAEYAGKHIRTLRSAALAQGWNATDIKDKDEIIDILVGDKPQPTTALPKAMTNGEANGTTTSVAAIVAKYMRALADELEHVG